MGDSHQHTRSQQTDDLLCSRLNHLLYEAWCAALGCPRRERSFIRANKLDQRPHHSARNPLRLRWAERDHAFSQELEYYWHAISERRSGSGTNLEEV